MKHVNVPAQITTVEDKVAGSLTMHQLLLLVAPIPINIIVYAILPTFLRMNIYKLAVMLLTTICFCLLSIKVKGKILLDWLSIVTKYNQRPQFYVFNKNTEYLRPTIYASNLETVNKNDLSQKKFKSSPRANEDRRDKEMIDFRILQDPKASLSFMITKKGSLNVYITKIN